MLVVMQTVDGSAAANHRSVGSSQWGRGHGDSFHLTEEITQVRRLVIRMHLPYHSLAILMVVPQCVDGIVGRHGGSVDTYGIIAFAHSENHFLTPVTKDVTRETGVVLCPVVHLTP